MRRILYPSMSLFVALLIVAGALPGSSQEGPPEGRFIPPKPPVSTLSLSPFDNRPVPMPLAERLRRGVVPNRGMCSTGVAGGILISGDGKMMVDVAGDPLSDRIMFRHESLLIPWKTPFEAPNISSVMPEVRKLMLQGKYRDGLQLALRAATDAGVPPGTRNHGTVMPLSMRIDLPEAGQPKDYLRTLDFESGEIKVLWTDSRGEWQRQTFVSRPDNVVVQLLTAPKGQSLSATIAVNTAGMGGRGGAGPAGAAGGVRFERDFNEQRLIVIGHFSPDTGNIGFAGVTRVVPVGGSVRLETDRLVISGAQSVTLLTRIEWYKDYGRAKVDALVRAVGAITPDYTALLARNRQVQSAIIDRVSVDFGGRTQRAMAVEELLADQRTRRGFSPALLEQVFDMGRYWLLAEGTGDYPSIAGHLNINVNLQIAPAAMGALPEASETFTKWIEGLLPDSRKNAENLFGARGALFSIHPDQQQGVLWHWTFSSPHIFWISCGGWAYSPMWDYYLVTGDREYLARHLVPGLKELALFYEDFLKETDANGNYIFVPSYSPENTPANADNTPAVINAVMDISVCKEVLTHLIQASETLGIEGGSVPKWKAMLAKMPPYLLDTDGALKEWAWPTLEENLDHRHVSHLYGVWPGDEIDPDRAPQLAKAFWLADRKRAQQNAAGHGLSHRGLAAARLKDDYLVNFELKQFLEQGYIGPTLRAAHNPYTPPMPDQQGSIPTLMMEMLVYSRPGVIELLPAVPETLTKGSIKGMLARTFAKVDDLTWDMAAKTVDVTLSSLRKQDITLIVRHGIQSITAPAGVLAAQPKPDATTCQLHLPQGQPVILHLKIGSHRPSDWVAKVPSR
ncbi:MAG: glycoside hydrolase N-terminal domain-containing protein [Candidatus Solibacter sp.]